MAVRSRLVWVRVRLCLKKQTNNIKFCRSHPNTSALPKLFHMCPCDPSCHITVELQPLSAADPESGPPGCVPGSRTRAFSVLPVLTALPESQRYPWTLSYRHPQGRYCQGLWRDPWVQELGAKVVLVGGELSKVPAWGSIHWAEGVPGATRRNC